MERLAWQFIRNYSRFYWATRETHLVNLNFFSDFVIDQGQLALFSSKNDNDKLHKKEKKINTCSRQNNESFFKKEIRNGSV